jgi:hypothetical protein
LASASCWALSRSLASIEMDRFNTSIHHLVWTFSAEVPHHEAGAVSLPGAALNGSGMSLSVHAPQIA